MDLCSDTLRNSIRNQSIELAMNPIEDRSLLVCVTTFAMPGTSNVSWHATMANMLLYCWGLSGYLICNNVFTVESKCATTGNNCVSSCTNQPNGDYQSCHGCHMYITCSNGISYDKRPCPASLVWNDDKKWCDWTSSTCKCSGEFIRSLHRLGKHRYRKIKENIQTNVCNIGSVSNLIQ